MNQAGDEWESTHYARTQTPLAGQLDVVMSKRGRVIDWASFDPSRYPDAALALAYDAQRMLATGEYIAISGFSEIVGALARHGAPFDIIGAAAAIPLDELVHAELAVNMAATFGSREPADVVLEVERLRPAARELTQEGLDIAMACTSAVGETLSTALLAACKARATDPVPRLMFTKIVSDEIRHARLGWHYLTWRIPQMRAVERRRLAAAVGYRVARAERKFSRGRDAPVGAQEAAAALGVLDSETQQRATREIMESQIVPALDNLGLGGTAAWNARERISA